jgi:hypothetical protein
VADGLGLTDLPIRAENPLPAFEATRQTNPQLFRQGLVGFRPGVVGRWQTEMPPDLQDLFWARHGGMMRELGYG